MSKRYTFVCEKHEEYGELGWKLKSKPHFEPLGGMATAHDILEHFQNDDGTAGGECQALGAMFLVRGETYQHIKNQQFDRTPGESLGSDLVELFNRQYPMPTPPATKRLDDAKIERWLYDAYGSTLHEASWSELDEKEEFKTFVAKAIVWMRIGYKRALKKYKDVALDIPYIFHSIETQADELLKNAYESQEMVVELDWIDKTATCELKEQF
jgi:hypothetical protein